MAWTHWICDTLTGERVQRVELTESRWDRLANAVGRGSHTISLAQAWASGRWTSRATFRDYWLGVITEWSRTLVVCWDEYPVYAGLISKEIGWDERTGEVSIETVEVRHLLSRRCAFGVTDYAGGDWGVYDLDLRSAAWVAISKGLTGGSTRWNIRLTPTWVSAGTVRRSYPRWEHRTVEEMLRELQDMEGGPDVDFRPLWSPTDNRLSWEPRLGVPLLQAPGYTWHAASASGATVTPERDATRITTGVHVPGNGSEADMKRAGVDVADPAYTGPFMDTVLPMPGEEDTAVLAAHGRAYGDTYSKPIEQRALVVRADGGDGPIKGPVASQLIPGIRAEVVSSGSLRIPDGVSTQYVLGVHGDLSYDIRLDVQEVRDAA